MKLRDGNKDRFVANILPGKFLQGDIQQSVTFNESVAGQILKSVTNLNTS